MAAVASLDRTSPEEALAKAKLLLFDLVCGLFDVVSATGSKRIEGTESAGLAPKLESCTL